MRARRASLSLLVGRDLTLAIAVCAVVVLASLFVQIHTSQDGLRERSLEGAARYIERHLTFGADGKGHLPANPGSSWASFGYPALVFDADGQMIYERPSGLDPKLVEAIGRQRLALIEQRRDKSSIRFYSVDLGEHQIIGAVMRSGAGRGERVIAVFKDENAPDVLIDDMVHQFPYDRVRLLVPVFAVLFLVAFLIVWRRTRPLAAASVIAARIGPGKLDVRLPEEKLPRELLPIVRAVNSALERIELGAEAQREFLRRAAHQLRTPLTVLSARAHLLDDAEAAEQLRGDVRALARIVSQLVQLNEVDGLPDRADAMADLAAVGEAVQQELAGHAAKLGNRIEVLQPETAVLVHGDPNLIEIAVRNLAENALEHSPPGCAVTLRVTKNGVVEVVDSGPGIPESLREQVSEPFWSANRDGSRAGLGLSIARRIAERCQGTLTIDDAVGGGTKVTLGFRLMGDPAILSAEALRASIPASLRFRRRLALDSAAD